MTIGTALFHTRALDGFQRMNGDISDLQNQVSSGKNDPRPSADPVRAGRLSAATEQQDRLTRYEANIAALSGRLDMADTTLDTAGDIMQRLREIALRGASDSTGPDERASLAIEARELRHSLIGAANARDATGRTLFGGFNSETDPYRDSGQGVVYAGNLGRPKLRVSESTMLDTGLPGPDVFGDPQAAGGTIFDAVDRLIAGLDRPEGPAPGMVDEIAAGVNQIADSRARIGAIANVAERQGDAVTARRVALDKVIAGLEDLDLAAATTRLKQLLVTREAAQLTFVKITQNSLFDYIR